MLIIIEFYWLTSSFVIDNQGKSSITNSLCFFKSDAFENKREQLLEDLRLSRKQLGNKNVVGKSRTVVNGEILVKLFYQTFLFAGKILLFI